MTSTAPKTILIVEDEEDIRSFYSEIFQEGGYNILEASNGQEGLDLLKNNHWDALLLDIMLPDRDGMHILEELRNEPSLKKGVVIMLTNLNSEPVIKESFALGADGYLVKAEITPDKIVSEIEQFFK